jgi:hypothetical protein
VVCTLASKLQGSKELLGFLVQKEAETLLVGLALLRSAFFGTIAAVKAGATREVERLGNEAHAILNASGRSRPFLLRGLFGSFVGFGLIGCLLALYHTFSDGLLG